MVGLLIAAILLSLIIGDYLEAVAISVVLVVNAVLGFATEWRARRAMEALLLLEATRALVMRNGGLQVVPAEAIVPGDIVQLDAGNRVPADVRLLEASDFSTDEAALTGESMPAEKQVEPLASDTVVADRSNMAYMGTAVASGTALAVVVATGQQTELGRIGTLVNAIDDEPTPLERRLDVLGRRLAWLTIGVAGLVSAVAALNGAPWASVLETGIALAVAAMPEALPAVATIALAVGMRRMARRQALVRRLPSVESLGSATVVCTDKTRTLTTGQMTVVQDLDRLRGDYRSEDPTPGAWPPAAVRVLEIAALASRPQVATGDAPQGGLANPVDLAILNALAGADTRRSERSIQTERGILPFSSARKLMAAFHGDRRPAVRVGQGCADGRPPTVRLDAHRRGAPGRSTVPCGKRSTTLRRRWRARVCG